MKKVFLLSLMLGVSTVVLADYRMTPREAVYYWASQGHLKNLKALQKSGYSLDMPDAHGRQAICEAVDKNDVQAFKTLQKAGANMNIFCLYNMSQEKRYEFNQVYYGLPLVVPAMTEKMLEEDFIVPVKPISIENPVGDSVYYTTESYVETDEGKQVNKSSLSESLVFKPYVAMNLFYGREKSKLEVSSSEKKSYHVSDNVPGLALAFGTRISDFRAELALQGHAEISDKIIDGAVKNKMQTYAGLLNAYYDIPTGTALKPYVGAGIGLAHHKATLTDDVIKYHNSDWSVAWQLAVGLNYTLTDNWVADLGYRYTDYGKVNIVKENGVNYKSDDIRVHNVTLGLRYEI